MRFRFSMGLVPFLFFAILLPTAALAQSSGSGAGSNPGWGAVAVDESNGAFGYAYGQSSERRARSIALNECRKHSSGCKIQISTILCMSLARAPDGAWGLSWNQNRNITRRQALQQCRKHATRCTIRFSVCN